jgi:pyruvate kinase
MRSPHGTKTKIVATVGPATETAERLAQLVEAGVDVFRLNLAHGRRDWHEAVLGRIRQVSKDLGHPLGILTDLGGPKIRLGPIAGESVNVEVGQVFRLVADPAAARGATDLTSTYPALVQQLDVGDVVLLVDGLVAMRVEAKQDGAVVCRVVQPGEIRSGAGINVPGVQLPGGALTEKDYGDVRWATAQSVDFFGLSFVRRPEDVRELRDELRRLGSNAQIVAKIEKAEAVEALDEIIGETDAIMVARGDLGVEIDMARIASVQKQIIQRCRQARVPVITATHMLESMRSSRLPTRAEATDVANAILDGSDALMLSAETAIGHYPVEAVAMMRSIARETERLLEPWFGREPGTRPGPTALPILDGLVEATSRLADEIRATLVLVATRDGHTALVLSKQRSRTPILGISDQEATVRRMSLYWGVTPLHFPEARDSAELLTRVKAWARERDLLRPGDRVVLLASTHWTATGHNMIVVDEAS